MWSWVSSIPVTYHIQYNRKQVLCINFSWLIMTTKVLLHWKFLEFLQSIVSTICTISSDVSWLFCEMGLLRCLQPREGLLRKACCKDILQQCTSLYSLPRFFITRVYFANSCGPNFLVCSAPFHTSGLEQVWLFCAKGLNLVFVGTKDVRWRDWPTVVNDLGWSLYVNIKDTHNHAPSVSLAATGVTMWTVELKNTPGNLKVMYL